QDGKSERDCLMDSFRRIAATCVEIKQGLHTYGGSMLEFWRDEETDIYQLQQNPKIMALYHAGWTAIDWELRRKLRRKPLALWLHGWFSSHAENYPAKVETIRQLSGSRNKQKSSFRRQLGLALAGLQAENVITDWAIDPKTDLVTIERMPSDPQQRHLSRKSIRTRKPSC
ncbi:plasmid replication initiator TrfA, partial [Candidatus Competibacter phosphatis]